MKLIKLTHLDFSNGKVGPEFYVRSDNVLMIDPMLVGAGNGFKEFTKVYMYTGQSYVVKETPADVVAAVNAALP